MNANETNTYPQEIFETHENWGDESWFADEATMTAMIENDLRNLGEDWEDCELADCTQWDFERIENGKGVYSTYGGLKRFADGTTGNVSIYRYFTPSDEAGWFFDAGEDLDE